VQCIAADEPHLTDQTVASAPLDSREQATRTHRQAPDTGLSAADERRLYVAASQPARGVLVAHGPRGQPNAQRIAFG